MSSKSGISFDDFLLCSSSFVDIFLIQYSFSISIYQTCVHIQFHSFFGLVELLFCVLVIYGDRMRYEMVRVKQKTVVC